MSLVKVFANIVRCFDTIFHPDIPIGRGLNYQLCYPGPYQTSSFSGPLCPKPTNGVKKKPKTKTLILVVTIRSSLKPVMISIVSIVTDPVRRRRDPMINARLSGFSTGKSGGYNANQDPTSISLLNLKI